MKLHRIYAMLLRHYFILMKSPDRMTEAFYFPMIDILVWGLTSTYYQQTSHIANLIVSLLSGIIFWTVIYRSQQEISISALEELWNKNLVNIFTAPLEFSEWMISIVIISVLKTMVSFVFVAILSLVLYKMNIFFYGFYLIPFLFLFTLSAWTIGFLVIGLVFRYSTRVQTLAWSLMALFAPVSAIYYSISILPVWAQKLALFIPTSYVFESMRDVIQKGTVDSQKLFISFILNIIYLALSLIYLHKSFKKVLEKGLVKVY